MPPETADSGDDVTGPDSPDRTIVADDGRVLYFDCRKFIEDIVKGGCCFVCGAAPGSKVFNDEHIIPRWVLRRFGIFNRSITLATGEKRTYDRYKIPCCKECNSLLGERIETPISSLLNGSYDEVINRLLEEGNELLFTWMALLFFKNHLKDITIEQNPNPWKSKGKIGDIYDWESFHHVHAVARSPYTRASLLPGVVGSICIYEINDRMHVDEFDYLTFSFAKVVMVRLGPIGIVAVLDDSGGAATAWDHKLNVIDAPISVIQLKEVAVMLAMANDDLIERPKFGTMVADFAVMIVASVPRNLRLPDFDPEKFGAGLLFALRDVVARRGIEVDGTKEPTEVAAKIRTGMVRFLTDQDGKLRRI